MAAAGSAPPRPAHRPLLRALRGPGSCGLLQTHPLVGSSRRRWVHGRRSEASRRASRQGQQLLLFVFSMQAGALLLARFPLPLASPNKNLSVGRPAAAAERHLSVAVVALQQVCAPRPPPPRGPTAAWCAALPNAGTPCAAFRCRVLGGPTLALDLAGGCATPLLSAPLRGRPRKGLLPQPLLQSVPQRDLTGAPRVCVHRHVVCGAPLLLWGQQRCSGWPAKR